VHDHHCHCGGDARGHEIDHREGGIEGNGCFMNDAKFQIPNYKFQTNPKSQLPMTERILFGILDFEHWNLFVAWCLEFGA
jgi:hypothetical protein